MGVWKRIEIGYLEPSSTTCEFCGKPLAGRHWEAVVAGRARTFCEPAHETKYVSYWLPRYGRSIDVEIDGAVSGPA